MCRVIAIANQKDGVEFDPKEGILKHEEGVDVIPSNKLLTGMDMSLITVYICQYHALYQKISNLKAAHPIISKIMEGEGDISFTVEEHKVVAEYFRLQFKLETMERQQLYFRGHTDCMAYLKRVGAI